MHLAKMNGLSILKCQANDCLLTTSNDASGYGNLAHLRNG
jgi:hypothetical protein